MEWMQTKSINQKMCTAVLQHFVCLLKRRLPRLDCKVKKSVWLVRPSYLDARAVVTANNFVREMSAVSSGLFVFDSR